MQFTDVLVDNLGYILAFGGYMDFINNSEQINSIVENIIGGICVFAVMDDMSLAPLYLNEGFYRMLGYSHKELDNMIKMLRMCIIPDDLPVFEQGLNDILKDDGAVEFEFRTVTGDGNIRWLQVRGNMYGILEGYRIIAGLVLDVTTRRSIEEELKLQAERLNILSESVREHIIDYNPRTDVMNVKLDKSAISHGDIVIKDFISSYDFGRTNPEDAKFIHEMISAASKSQMSDSLEFRSSFFEDDEQFHWNKINITSVLGNDGYVSRIVGRVVNIDEEKKKEEELRLKADIDPLTGLYNKGAATTLISKAIEDYKNQKVNCAMLMLDLDNFKAVNDNLGHAVGDTVIADTGRILKETFKGRDIVGRMGGDEFMIFIVDIKDINDAMILAGKLNKLMRRTFGDSVTNVSVSSSIGIAEYNGLEADFNELYIKADKALYNTKENGKNGRTLYCETTMERIGD